MTLLDDIHEGESNALELKRAVPKEPMKYVKTAIAFSNGGGGRIVFGVDDETRHPVGIEGDIFRTMDNIIADVCQYCDPYPNVDGAVANINGKDLIVITVEAGTNRPYHVKNKPIDKNTFIRMAGTTLCVDMPHLRSLSAEGSGTSFDRMEYAPKKLDAVALERLCETASKRAGKAITPANLVNWGLLIEEGGAMKPTRGFRLLTDNPFVQARIQCARFRGKDKVIFEDRKEFNGPINEQIDDAEEFVINNIFVGAKIEGLYREDVFEVPKAAIREIISNAVLHRDYYLEEHPIFVAVYDDRIEVDSPGFLPTGITLEKMKSGFSKPRNMGIASFFKETKLVEGWGSRVQRAVADCIRHGLKAPEVLEIDDILRFRIYRKGYEWPKEPVRAPFSTALDDYQTRILDYLEANPCARYKDIGDALSMSVPTVRRKMDLLKDMGLLSKKGNTKASSWTVERDR
ncbi:MAG: putative DNA binding domain-containing protein [Candidatus Methanoplasma sp.]|jgi:predicted HTH transcriptional regulator|nr:putative DNA binding domain-containing protein [Candidatus Methanoplasma sp.]